MQLKGGIHRLGRSDAPLGSFGGPPGAWEQRIATVALVLLLAAGILLRILLTRAQAPAFLNISDGVYYLTAAHTNVFVWAAEPASPTNSPWPAGYPVLLAMLYVVNQHVSAIAVAQHGLGIATALIWYWTLRRVVSPLWALIPAFVVLVAGPQVVFEHAPMAETPFSFLIAACVYSSVRAVDGNVVIWGALAGLTAAAAGCVRVIGVLLIPLTMLWLLLVVSGDRYRRLCAGALVCVAATLLIGVYLVEMKHQTGYGGPSLTRGGHWSAPEAAGQPKTSYLDRVGHDLTRYWHSEDRGGRGGFNYDGLAAILWPAGAMDLNFTFPYLTRGTGTANITWWYHTTSPQLDDNLRASLFTYEKATRLEGIRLVLLLLVAIVGVVLATELRRAVLVLVLAITAVLLLTPVFYLHFDARYAIPAYGPLAAAGAIGAAAIWDRATQRLRKRLDRSRGKRSNRRLGARAAGGL